MAETVVARRSEELLRKYLTFWMDGQTMGISLTHVEQIVSMQEITPVPEFPAYYKGIMNLRGTIIPIMDLRLRLGRDAAEYTDRTSIIISDIEDFKLGFIVDLVDEVITVSPEQFSQAPQMSGEKFSGYISGIARINDGEKLALLLNPTAILKEKEFELLSARI